MRFDLSARISSLRAAALALPLGLGLMTLGASGCAPDYPECKKDKHCKQELDEKCVDGMCQNCTIDDDCKA